MTHFPLPLVPKVRFSCPKNTKIFLLDRTDLPVRKFRYLGSTMGQKLPRSSSLIGRKLNFPLSWVDDGTEDSTIFLLDRTDSLDRKPRYLGSKMGHRYHNLPPWSDGNRTSRYLGSKMGQRYHNLPPWSDGSPKSKIPLSWVENGVFLQDSLLSKTITRQSQTTSCSCS